MDDVDILDIFAKTKPRRAETKAKTEQQPIAPPTEKKTGNGNPKLEALLKRADQLDALIASEKLKQQKREQRETEKLDRLLGSAVRKTGAGSSDFRLMIAQTALSGVTDEKERNFLKEKGWL
jgi:hypothetical protein